MQSNGQAFKDGELTVCVRISSLARRAVVLNERGSVVTKSHLINPRAL